MRYRFQFRRYRLPFRVPVRTGHGLWAEREGLIVRLDGETGSAGYGEAAPIPLFGTETVDEVEAACLKLGGTVDEEQLDALPPRFGCLRRALATARGGNITPLSRKSLGIAALLPAGRAALAAIAPKAELGFRVFKWKVGVGDVADELGLLDDVCAALPSGGTLRLDANGAWDRRAAERWLERCAERPVEFIEQPCFADATQSDTQRRRTDDLLLGLANDFPTPIALDESLAGDGDVERWIGAGWRGVFVVKPSLLGDLAGSLTRLSAANAAVVFSSALETPVGARAALQAAFAWLGESRALGFGVWPLFDDARFDCPFVAPFVRWEDVERIQPEAVWTALS